MNERGSVTVVVAAIGAVVLLLMIGLASIANVLRARTAAAGAADAAALAAAPVTFRPFGADGSAAEEAAKFAALNGSILVACDCPQDSSWNERSVSVRVRQLVDVPLLGTIAVEATSRAQFTPAALLRSDE